MGLGVGSFLSAAGDAIFCGACGLGRGSGTHRNPFDPSLSVDDDLYDKLYNQGQAHLGNLMTVSTLLLGFTVSGTFLAVVLTGNENYDAEQLFDFVEAAGKAAMAASVTLILSLAVSVRSNSGYTNVSAQRGQHILRRSSAYTSIAEIMIYVSFFYFADTLGKFTTMQFAGPDICASSSGGSLVKEQAFCARLGKDFFAEATGVCLHNSTTTRPPLQARLDGSATGMAAAGSATGMAAATTRGGNSGTVVVSDPTPPPGYTSEMMTPEMMAAIGNHGLDASVTDATIIAGPPNSKGDDDVVKPLPAMPSEANAQADAAMCAAYQYLTSNGWVSYQYWFGYSIGYYPPSLLNTSEIIDKTRLQIVVAAAGYICAVDKMADNKEHACDYKVTDASLTQNMRTECSQATVAYTKAEDCVEGVVNDADKCYKVCSKREVDGETPSERLAFLVRIGTNPMRYFFLAFGLFRAVAHLADGAINKYHVMQDASEHDEYDEMSELDQEGGSARWSPRCTS